MHLSPVSGETGVTQSEARSSSTGFCDNYHQSHNSFKTTQREPLLEFPTRDEGCCILAERRRAVPPSRCRVPAPTAAPRRRLGLRCASSGERCSSCGTTTAEPEEMSSSVAEPYELEQQEPPHESRGCAQEQRREGGWSLSQRPPAGWKRGFAWGGRCEQTLAARTQP